MQKIKAEIHLGNIRRNAEKFSALTQKQVCAVVKANAYGHGAEQVVSALSGVVDSFAVALIEEGIAIRTVCSEDVLVFTPPLTEEEIYALSVNGLTVSIGDFWTAKLVVETCEKYRLYVKVHLKINSGMNRYGMDVYQLGKVCTYLKGNPFVQVEGIYSHLYTCDRETSLKQRSLFMQSSIVCKRYFPNVKAHLSATYGCLLGEKFAFDMVRVGIGLYGYLPMDDESEEMRVGKSLELQKGMEIYAPIVTNRKYAFGGIGYGLLNENLKNRRLSVCRVGYADGFLRKKSNGMESAETHLNSLCMDVCLQSGGGRRGKWSAVLLDAEKTARETETIVYEVLCAATRRAEFVYDYE